MPTTKAPGRVAEWELKLRAGRFPWQSHAPWARAASAYGLGCHFPPFQAMYLLRWVHLGGAFS